MPPIANRWYYSFKNGANALVDQVRIVEYMIVVYQLVQDKKNPDQEYRKYAAYSSGIDLYNHYLEFDVKEFHEVILGNRKQRVYFDIDLEADQLSCGYTDIKTFGIEIVRQLILELKRVLSEYNYDFDPIKDLIICTSSSLEKVSFHLILPWFYHTNNIEAKYFVYQLIAGNFILETAQELKIIDAVYTTQHSLRLIGSTKRGERAKSLVDSFQEYNWQASRKINTNRETRDQFLNTLITWVPRACKKVGVKLPAPKVFAETIIDSKLLAIVEDVLAQPEYNCFVIRDYSDSTINLTRVASSHCSVCNRIHYKEHPFLHFDPAQNIYLNCRRNSTSRLIYSMPTTSTAPIIAPSKTSKIAKLDFKQLEAELLENPVPSNISYTSIVDDLDQLVLEF